MLMRNRPFSYARSSYVEKDYVLKKNFSEKGYVRGTEKESKTPSGRKNLYTVP